MIQTLGLRTLLNPKAFKELTLVAIVDCSEPTTTVERSARRFSRSVEMSAIEVLIEIAGYLRFNLVKSEIKDDSAEWSKVRSVALIFSNKFDNTSPDFNSGLVLVRIR
ncbi:hypothetical protein WICPIJ_009165 [Wickerhamomyces pijperi]|uniref:Uncharacterized protein n=1 Tax=Wickerhamomyces pijperi TaxID=599730 RepID=A0A9P8TF22_WICPI|nr:hypothetical protein WICPIJ_009165 [Wickerhamomyces pijperi]